MTRIGGGILLLIGIALWIFAVRALMSGGGTSDGTGLLGGRGTAIATSTTETGDETTSPGIVPTVAGTSTATGASGPTDETYTVQAGDTLTRIANKLGVELDNLVRANPQIEDPTHLQIGQVLNIPE